MEFSLYMIFIVACITLWVLFNIFIYYYFLNIDKPKKQNKS